MYKLWGRANVYIRQITAFLSIVGGKMYVLFLTLYLDVPSADNFCKQFGPRSGPTKDRA